MKRRYADLSGKSGITHYDDAHEGRIDVWYESRREPYRYRAARIGADHLRRMIELARDGAGLASYIRAHPDVWHNSDG